MDFSWRENSLFYIHKLHFSEVLEQSWLLPPHPPELVWEAGEEGGIWALLVEGKANGL